jgi:hypothetical protein
MRSLYGWTRQSVSQTGTGGVCADATPRVVAWRHDAGTDTETEEKKLTSLLDWFQPIETATTLEQIHERWDTLLEEYDVVGSFEDLRYHDAVLSFLARSALPANLQFGALFACVSDFDFDLRLALGLLDDALDRWQADSSPDRPMLYANCIDIPCSNPWLLGYVHGRLTEVRAAMRRSDRPHTAWALEFWNEFLVMSCRWADMEGIHLAIGHGAQTACNDYQPFAVTAEGIAAHYGDAYYARGRSNADYHAVLDLLFGLGTDRQRAGAAALEAAARVGNLDLLRALVEYGVDVRAVGEAALAAAAGHHQIEALDWLLAYGVDPHAGHEAALIAAVEGLALPTAEALLDAGADLKAVETQALRTAFAAMPEELFAGDCHDFIYGRAAMITLLLERGADPRTLTGDAALRAVPHFEELLAHLLREENLSSAGSRALRSALGLP